MKVFRFVSLALLALASARLLAADEKGPVSAVNAWKMLREGSERFANGMTLNPHTKGERRNEVIEGQHPFATILASSDSRVPVERILDQGIGDLYTVRVLGNSAGSEAVVGSIEYGVLHAGTNLVLVLGNTKDLAVAEALKGVKNPGTSIDAVISKVGPAADYAKDDLNSLKGADLSNEAIERNVLHSMRQLLLASPKIRERISDGTLKVIGAVYNLHNGRVHWLGEHPKQKELLEEK